jgi:hypothetical protein
MKLIDELDQIKSELAVECGVPGGTKDACATAEPRERRADAAP